MKNLKLKNISFIILIVLGISCATNKNSKDSTEHQEEYATIQQNCSPSDTLISYDNVILFLQKWRDDPPKRISENPEKKNFPDKFDISIETFSKFVGNANFFRIYYGLEESSKDTNMLLFVTPLDDMCSKTFPEGKALVLNEAGRLISKGEALKYSENWQTFFQTSVRKDTVNEGGRRNFIIPLAYSFNTQLFDEYVKKNHSSFGTYMGLELTPVKINSQEEEIPTFRFMMVLHGCSGKCPELLSYTVESSDDYLDFASPCPHFCEDEFLLTE